MSGARDVRLEEPLLRLKLANRKSVKALHGTALAAEAAGTRQQRISDCTLPNTPDFLRQDEVHAIEEAARGSPDWPAITRAQARNHGFALLPIIDSGAALGSCEWHQAIAAVSREANDAVSKICAALGDGEVTAQEVEAGEIVEEIDEALSALARLRGLAEAKLRDAGRPVVRSIAGGARS